MCLTMAVLLCDPFSSIVIFFLRNRRGSGSLYWNILKDKQAEEFTKQVYNKKKKKINWYCDYHS